jgi:hypothetical protein
VPGVTLSRWTLSYFTVALAALMVAQALMAAGFGFPNASLRGPETLVVVHLVAIGWLSLLMLGALFQFVPVLSARALSSDRAAGISLLGLTIGLATLAAGFLRLADVLAVDLPYFPVAAVLLGAGFALAVHTLGRTLHGGPSGLPTRFVAVGLASLTATAMLGVVFAFVLGGSVDTVMFLEIAAAGVPVHAAVGLGGWMTFTAMGVSYRLFAMFMLAPETERPSTRWVLRLGTWALVLVLAGGFVAMAAGLSVAPVLAAAFLLCLVGLGLYGYDVFHLYRARMRKVIELNSRMAVLAFASLAGSVALAASSAALGPTDARVAALVFLCAFGWLTGLGLAKLYKIVAFLTWLECYGPVLGKTPTPRVQDLVDEKRATPWFVAYFLSVWAATAALLLSAPLAFRMAAAVMAVATAGVVLELVRTRRLVDVTAARPLPAGVHRPRLFVSTPH